MFEHLLDAVEADFTPEILADALFTPDAHVSVADLIDGKVATRDWLEKITGSLDEEVLASAQQSASQQTFSAISGGMNEKAQKTALAKVTTPAAVQHLVGMLTAYDWAFVERAKELRGYCVAKIVEETTHPDARYRLRALEMLGKVTEVGLFTERVEVIKPAMSDIELDDEIQKRTEKYMGLLQKAEKQRAVDAEVIDIPQESNADALPDDINADA